ncbi:methyl-accepting chemotaxis protein [Paenibacillus methanolicus]|uniref:Methyl-accepting chemotaxis protein n=1 Tax=Paenibacillus methanolicus TaxID=582686 RepID=A0A5S5BV82_9BACL|nr:methyl-accepting chemotaxis protein [Paenibacillus methanolicus]TYP70080.1 methyl-accepting chemotaxis protein [Paenibacillus methanolicus]
MRFRSINARMLATMLPIVVLTLLGLVLYSNKQQRDTLYVELERGMNNGLNRVINQMNVDLNAHSKMVQSLARTIETNPFRSKDELQAIFEGSLPVNKDTFGIGVFYEPYAYDPETKYESVYGFKEGDKASFTDAYNDPAYDYHNQPWYKDAINSEKAAVVTDPYYDETTKSTLITFSIPLRDEEKKPLGVMTGDISLNSLQAYVGKMVIGNTGWAFLIDRNGTYLGHPDQTKLMKTKVQDETEASLAEMGKAMLAGESGTANFKNEDGNNQAFYQRIPELGWTLALVEPDTEWLDPINDLKRKMYVICALAVLVLAASVFFFGRTIGRAARGVTRLSRSLAEGDFTYRIKKESEDEFGRMADNFNGTMDTLEGTLAGVVQNAHTVASTSEQLTASAEQTSRATEQIAHAISRIAEGSTRQVEMTAHGAGIAAQVSASVRDLAGSVEAASESSLRSREEAVGGSDVVRSAVDQMNVIDERIQGMAAIMQTLGSKSKQIDGIITLITTISGQTHLLALNAAIEAARAGEHGREFAVVADEVRKLAEESTVAAEQIRDIITDIQRDTKRAVDAVAGGSAALAEGINRVGQTGATFQGIRETIEQLSSRMREARDGIRAVSAQMDELAGSIAGVSEIARESADGTHTVASSAQQQNASMEEVAAASAMLAKMAGELMESVQSFKLSTYASD